ncbi:MAG: hypothetical protein HPY67_15595 [Syntrophaceae bacterium]|nr:hypothetical protein [Syntrophaceae bacterium]
MAEIKSTIDLIMERTKNLSATPEEREAWHRREREKHFRSLVQRLLDHSLSLDDAREELEREKKSGRAAEALGHLKNALAAHADPDSDNEHLFRIVSGLVGSPVERLRETLRSWQAESSARKTALAERQRAELESSGIAGSAVLPNPEADPQWKTLKDEMQAALARRLLDAIDS